MINLVIRKGCKEYSSKQTIKKKTMHEILQCFMVGGNNTKGAARLHFRLSTQVYKAKDLVWPFKILLTTILAYGSPKF